MSSWKKREASDKGKTGDSKGVGAISDHDKPNPPRLLCSVCRGPYRKPACQHLPCTYCKEQGYVRHDCSKRLADRKGSRARKKR